MDWAGNCVTFTKTSELVDALLMPKSKDFKLKQPLGMMLQCARKT